MTKGILTGSAVEHEDYIWLIIPLEPGGKNFVECAKGVSIVEDGFLKIFVARTIADSLGIRDGSIVEIDNYDEKLNIRLAGNSN